MRKYEYLFRNIGGWLLGIIVAGNVLFEIAGLFLIGCDRNAGYAAFVALGSVIILPVIWAYRKYAGLSWVIFKNRPNNRTCTNTNKCNYWV